MTVADDLSIVLLFALLIPLGYLFTLLFASIRSGKIGADVTNGRKMRFMIAIPAHDEENVIQNTVEQMLALDYPSELFDVHIVADHCSDRTALLAAQAGAVVHERNEGPRTGKGAALSWLFARALFHQDYDAVVVFDADTRVAGDFLTLMDAHLSRGDQAVQGQHIIVNYEQGLFPALTWAMFLVDNRYQNLGRSNLGWSAKNMGDSICFRTELLEAVGWGSGLTEDYHLRQLLLLDGVRITYEPYARGYGEAPLTWAQARAQRARWLSGTHTSSRLFARQLFKQGILNHNAAQVDGALQCYLPSYSTLTLLVIAGLVLQLLVDLLAGPVIRSTLIWLWLGVLFLVFIYPFPGLLMEHAPPRAYLAILTGPFFILWRSWLAVVSRLKGKNITWIRTEHGNVLDRLNE